MRSDSAESDAAVLVFTTSYHEGIAQELKLFRDRVDVFCYVFCYLSCNLFCNLSCIQQTCTVTGRYFTSRVLRLGELLGEEDFGRGSEVG